MMLFYDLSKRFLLTVISLVVAFGLLVFSSTPFVAAAVLLLLLGLVGVALWEYARIVGVDREKKSLVVLIALGEAVCLSFFLSALTVRLATLPIACLVGGALCLFALRLRAIEGASAVITKGFFGLCYIAVPLGLLSLMLYGEYGGGYLGNNKWNLAYLILVTKSADIGAYLGGRLWGKRALAPRLSPKKTIEGALIGWGTSLIVSVGVVWVARHFCGGACSLWSALALGGVLGVVGQVGDLAESLFKREAGVKDSNRLPGFGGILDMLDSLLFTTPAFYLFLAAVN